MNLIDFIKYVIWKVKIYNSEAKNPFTQRDYGYNPFESVFTRTYVWVEQHNDKYH